MYVQLLILSRLCLFIVDIFNFRAQLGFLFWKEYFCESSLKFPKSPKLYLYLAFCFYIKPNSR